MVTIEARSDICRGKESEGRMEDGIERIGM